MIFISLRVLGFMNNQLNDLVEILLFVIYRKSSLLHRLNELFDRYLIQRLNGLSHAAAMKIILGRPVSQLIDGGIIAEVEFHASHKTRNSASIDGQLLGDIR